jgi:hypothetical protein
MKAAKSMYSTPASARKAAVPSQPTDEFDDDHVKACSMLEVASVASFSSSSSSESSASKSIQASPPLIPDVVILVELLNILELPELKAAQQTMLLQIVVNLHCRFW